MSHIGYLSNQNQATWSDDRSQTPCGLPLLNWAANLYKCDTAESEVEDKNIPSRHNSSIAVEQQI